MDFSTFQWTCKYMKLGCDEDRRVSETCRHPRKIPPGDSWGECSERNCPYFPKEGTNLTIYDQEGNVIGTAEKFTYS